MTIQDNMESVQPLTPLNKNELNDKNVDFKKAKQIKEKIEENDGGSTSKEIMTKKTLKKRDKKDNKKKRKFEEKLIENTQKIDKIKRKKINT